VRQDVFLTRSNISSDRPNDRPMMGGQGRSGAGKGSIAVDFVNKMAGEGVESELPQVSNRSERLHRSPGWTASEAGLRSDAGATAEGRKATWVSTASKRGD
jgi:hypothetical protein